MNAAEAATRAGSTCTIVGVGNMEDQFVLNPLLTPIMGKRVLGSMYGGCNPTRHFPRLLDFYREGKLDLDGMITARRPLEEVNEGFADLAAGKGIRTVLEI